MTRLKSRHGTLAAQQSGLPMLRTSRFSTQTRDAWIASLVQEAGGLPAVFAVRHRMLRKRIVQTPARRTEARLVRRRCYRQCRCNARVGSLSRRGTPR